MYPVAESAAQYDGDIGPDSFHLPGHLITGHLRHVHIGDDQVVFLGIGPECLDGVDGACPGFHPVTQPFQQFPAEADQRFFVVHKEDALTASGELIRLLRSGLGRCVGGRQKYVESRADPPPRCKP